MVRYPAVFVVLFLACVYAVPVPDNPKFTVVKDSSFGTSFAGWGSMTSGVVKNNKDSGVPNEIGAESPIDTGNSVPDVTIFDKVDVGHTLAVGDSIGTGVMRDNEFIKNPFA